MSNYLKCFIPLMLIAFCNVSFSQDTYTLKYHWKTGQVIKNKISIDADVITRDGGSSDAAMPTSLRNSMIITAKVISIDDKSNAKFQITFDNHKMEMNGADITSQMDKSKMPAITVTYDPYGAIVGNPEIKGPNSAANLEQYLNGLPLFGIALPDHPIKVGDTWTHHQKASVSNALPIPKVDAKIKMLYKLVSVEDHNKYPCYKIQLKFNLPTNIQTEKGGAETPPEISSKNDGTAYYWVDRHTLETLECTSSSTSDMKVKSAGDGDSKTSSMEMHLQTNVKMEKLYETAAVKPELTHKEVTTKSGLKYLDETIGDGPAPKKGDTVVVTYVGTFTDGKKFDASADHGGTFEFVLGAGNVIPGWDEGVATMQKGGTRRLTVPSSLAYGDQGIPGAIPGGATLIFEIRLLDIK